MKFFRVHRVTEKVFFEWMQEAIRVSCVIHLGGFFLLIIFQQVEKILVVI